MISENEFGSVDARMKIYAWLLFLFNFPYWIAALLPPALLIEGCSHDLNVVMYMPMAGVFLPLFAWNIVALSRCVSLGKTPVKGWYPKAKIWGNYLYVEAITVFGLLHLLTSFSFVLVSLRESTKHGIPSAIIFALSVFLKLGVVAYIVAKLLEGKLLSHQIYGMILQSELRSSAWIYLKSFQYRIENPFPTLELWQLFINSICHLVLEDIPQTIIQLHFLATVEECSSSSPFVVLSLVVGLGFSAGGTLLEIYGFLKGLNERRTAKVEPGGYEDMECIAINPRFPEIIKRAFKEIQARPEVKVLELKQELPIDAFNTFLSLVRGNTQIKTIISSNGTLTGRNQAAIGYAFHDNRALEKAVFRKCRYSREKGLQPLADSMNAGMIISHISLEDSPLPPESMEMILSNLAKVKTLRKISLVNLGIRDSHRTALESFLREPGAVQDLVLLRHELTPEVCEALMQVGSSCQLSL